MTSQIPVKPLVQIPPTAARSDIQTDKAAQHTLASSLDYRFNEMESILNTLCHTVATLQSQMKKEDRPKSSSESELKEQRALMTSREQALVDQATIQ